ncbi:hypothetical protein BURK2_03833 [Burkholderiales bacterium]|nr:hypothetical protein BURK2_03833 [Burkholderiales bacterium]
MKQTLRFILVVLALLPAAAFAGVVVQVASVPTLGEFALVGLGGALAVAGVLVLWRRRK